MNAPVRVSLDASAIPARPVGAGRYVLELATALARGDDVELTVVTRRRDGVRWRAAGPAEVASQAPAFRPTRLLWEQLALPRTLRDLGVAVHHAPHYTMPERARLPMVVTVHDMTFFEHPEWHQRTKAPFFRRAIGVAARRADAIVCVSGVTADRLGARLHPRAPVHVVPHGVDHARFRARGSPDDEPALAALGVRAPYVAFLGTV
ncbi:MAG: glycosyltransferase [Acidimicrobiia bacterium]|nr:glycosyltransferase [Acidimicrobiia bacterium]